MLVSFDSFVSAFDASPRYDSLTSIRVSDAGAKQSTIGPDDAMTPVDQVAEHNSETTNPAGLRWFAPYRGLKHTKLVAGFLAVVLLVMVSIRFEAPPRFDETGYLILAESLADGHGYREIDKPGEPVHTHFPPGWPVFLATFWCFASSSTEVRTMIAHGVVAGLWLAAVLLWRQWFRICFPFRIAQWLTIALAGNWLWLRLAGELRSESLFIVLSGLVLLQVPSKGGAIGRLRAVSIGGLLGLAILTRHIGLALAAAIVIELALRKRFPALAAAMLVTAVVILPWIVTQVVVGQGTQAELLVASDGGAVSFAERMGSQLSFYVRRLPDSLFGPFVETATVFRGDRAAASIATAGAGIFSMLWLAGVLRMLRHQRTRPAGLYLISSMAILVVWPFTEAGRFLIPLIPANLGAIAYGADSFAAWAAFRWPQLSWIQGRSALAIALCALPFGLYTASKAWRQNPAEVDARFDSVCRWIDAELPGDCVIAARHPGDVYWRTRRKAVALPEANSPAEAARMLRAAGADFLVLDQGRYVGETGPRWLDELTGEGEPRRFIEVSAPDTSMKVFRIRAGDDRLR